MKKVEYDQQRGKKVMSTFMDLQLDRQKFSIAVGLAALSLTTAMIVSVLKLPVYLDSFGIVIASIVLGWRYGLVTAGVICIVGYFIVNPYLPAYALTAGMIAITSSFLYSKGMFNNLFRVVISGLIIAAVSALTSAPVTAFLFSGNTLSGVDAITAYLRSTGKSLIESVLITGFTSEPVDKVIVCVISYLAIIALPPKTVAAAGLRTIPTSKK